MSLFGSVVFLSTDDPALTSAQTHRPTGAGVESVMRGFFVALPLCAIFSLVSEKFFLWLLQFV